VLLHPLARVMQACYPTTPYISVITDLVTVHRAWMMPYADLVISPSPMATRALIALGQPADRIVETGLPVSRGFSPVDPTELASVRLSLGLDPQRPVVLMMHGAEGHKRLLEISSLLDEQAGCRIQQVVICGKNEGLRRKLAARSNAEHIHVLGFTRSVSAYMRAADVLVTKAGSLSVSEALACGCPLVISEYLPGQESGTSEWLASAGAGYSAGSSEHVVAEVIALLANPYRYRLVRARARALGRSDASTRAAESILHLCGKHQNRSLDRFTGSLDRYPLAP
jgi:UDP-N-acetylglucosamine:LPS N-acetylglucosamine transferase